ncbi:hypothetical protein D3C87_2106680 [compost metagenome]
MSCKWGSSSSDSKVCIGKTGTSASLSRVRHSSVVRLANSSLTMAYRSVMLAVRVLMLAKRGSESYNSGLPMTRRKARQ